MKAENTAVESRDDFPAENRGGQFLCFSLGDDLYAFNILKVQEIRGWEPVRVIPESNEYMKGVLDLRGTIVPIVDLRERFGLSDTRYTNETVVIVLSVEQEGRIATIGVVVDGVSDVLDLTDEDINVSDSLSGQVNSCYLHGMAKRGDNIVILLDSDRLFDLCEMRLVEEQQ